MIPSRERCQEIVKNSEVFYCNERHIQGYRVELYNYRLAVYKDFKDNDAFELRGLAYLYNPKTKEYERNMALGKFFNINENEDWLESSFKGARTLNIQDKRDGSMIVPIRLPNGYIALRTKMSFDSPQATLSQELYDKSPKLQKFVEDCINIGSQPIFELTSGFNQVVINYNETKLTLLQIRDSNGHYIKDVNSIAERYDIDCVENIETNLDAIMKDKDTVEGIEGWVIRYEDRGTKFAKVKTKWYIDRHFMMTETSRENYLIPLILDDKIDDILSDFQEGETKEHIEMVIEKISNNFNHLVQETLKLRDIYINEYKRDNKSFASRYKNDLVFGFVMKTNKSTNPEKDIESRVKNYILKETYRLDRARDYLKSV